MNPSIHLEKQRMRNIDRMRQISVEELAQLLVHETEEDIGDYDYDENPIPLYVTFWNSPSGNLFQNYCGNGKQEAIDDCCRWLDSEYDEKEETNLLCDER